MWKLLVWNVRPIIFVPMLTVYLVLGVKAQDDTYLENSTFQSIISQQISAFRAGDAVKAFSFASSGVRKKFKSPDAFVRMAKAGYRPLFAPKSFEFGRISNELGSPTQHVNVVGPQGKRWIALYGFEQNSDKSWKINGVVLVKIPAVDA